MHSCDINHENIINIKLDRSMYVEVLTVVHDWCRNPSKLVVFSFFKDQSIFRIPIWLSSYFKFLLQSA